MDRLEITKEEILNIFKDQHEDRLKSTLDQMIKYFRHLNKEDDGTKGTESLNQMVQQGMIKMDLYLKIREVVESPELDYEITIN